MNEWSHSSTSTRGIEDSKVENAILERKYQNGTPSFRVTCVREIIYESFMPDSASAQSTLIDGDNSDQRVAKDVRDLPP